MAKQLVVRISIPPYIRVFDADNGFSEVQVNATLPLNSEFVAGKSSYNPIRKLLAVPRRINPGQISIVDAQTWNNVVHTFDNPTMRDAYMAAFSPDGRYLAVVMHDYSLSSIIYVLDGDNGWETIPYVPGIPRTGLGSGANVPEGIAWSPDSQYFGVGGSGLLRTVRMPEFQADSFSVRVGPIHDLAVNPVSGHVYVPGFLNNVHFRAFQTTDWTWGASVVSGTPTFTQRRRSVSVSPDGLKVAISGDSEPFLRIYNATTWATLATPTAPFQVRQVRWEPDGDRLAYVERNTNTWVNALRCYDTNTGQSIAMPEVAGLLNDVIWADYGPDLPPPPDGPFWTGFNLTYEVP